MSTPFIITDEERINVIKNYFQGTDCAKLINFPRQNKKKFIVLEHIIKNFEPGRKYTEKEVNEILMKIHEDYVTLRRALADYRFIDRHRDCSAYWVNEQRN